jgi:Transcriptional regulator, AbiEi antitoxin
VGYGVDGVGGDGHYSYVRDDNVAAGRALAKIAAGQAGVVTRAQAFDCGLSKAHVDGHLAHGRWQRVYRGVYATFSGPVPRRSILWASVLRAGPDALLSHETAAEVSGLSERPSRSVHVTVPVDRSPGRIAGVVIHRSTRAVSNRHPTRMPPQTRIEDTVVDLTQTAAHIEDAVSWLARAVGGRLTTAPRLAARLRSRPKLRWRSLLCAALGDVEAGCHSLIELAYLRDVERAHGLPASQRQARRQSTTTQAGRQASSAQVGGQAGTAQVGGQAGTAQVGGQASTTSQGAPHGRVGYDDVRYRRYATRIELDGLAAHSEHARWRDMRRDNAAVIEGDRVLRYGLGDVESYPCHLAAQVASVLRLGGWRGNPGRCARPDCVVP